MADILAKMAVVIEGQTASFNKAMQQSHAEVGKFQEGIKDVAKELIAGFGLFEIGKEIIDVTSQFQKLEAVLSNALGSDSAGARVFKEIQEFASKTPFSVEELTKSFTKLTVEGFKPTIEEMNSLGDLATATGTSFDTLTTDLIKAQQGQFRALKDLGVQAKESGDKIIFTFRGIKTAVDNNADSIKEYIVNLGNAEGITGAMAKTSETLGGKITTLGHAWEDLLATIGNGTSGPLTGAVTALTNILNTASHLSNELELDKVTLGFKNFKELSGETLDYITNFLRANSGKKISDILQPITSQKDAAFFTNYEANAKKFVDSLVKEGESVGDANVLWEHYVETRLEAKKANNADDFEALKKKIQEASDSAKDFVKKLTFKVSDLNSIDAVQEKLKLVTQVRDASTGNTLTVYNNKIADLTKKLKDLQSQGLNTGVIGQLNKQISELETKKIDTKNILDFSGINTQIKSLQDKLKFINNLSVVDSVKSISNEFIDKAFGLDDKGIEEATRRIDKKIKDLTVKIKQKFIDIGPLVANGIANIADSIGQALGSGNFDHFGDNLLKAVTSFMSQLGGLMITLGTGEILLRSGNPALMIAGGAALVAAAAAIDAMTSKQSQTFSSAMSSGASTGRANAGAANTGQFSHLQVSGQFKILGKDLVYILNREGQLNSRTGG